MNIKIIQKKSPNFDKRPKGTKINSIIIHYTGMKTFDDACKRLCDRKSKVSSHYLIGRNDISLQRNSSINARISHAALYNLDLIINESFETLNLVSKKMSI